MSTLENKKKNETPGPKEGLHNSLASKANKEAPPVSSSNGGKDGGKGGSNKGLEGATFTDNQKSAQKLEAIKQEYLNKQAEQKAVDKKAAAPDISRLKKI